MAAGRATETGVSVKLLEKMDRPGRKLLLTGKGRCNISNTKELDEFISMYGKNGQFLRNVFSIYFRDDLLMLLHRYGIGTRVEPDGRIFPVSNKASDISRALEDYINKGNVCVKSGVKVTEILTNQGKVIGVKTGEQIYPGSAVILATGGTSYPDTGSSGDGYRLASALGHTIVKLRPALVPLIVEESELVQKLQGVSLRDIKLTSFACQADEIKWPILVTKDCGRGISGRCQNPLVIESRRGDLLFTHFGISGPATLQMSLAIVVALECSPVSVSIDFLPDLTTEELRKQLQNSLDDVGRKKAQNFLKRWLPDKVIDIFLAITNVDNNKLSNQISSEERERIVSTLKSFRLNISSSLSIDKAMVTAGGVSLKEINPQTMASRLVKGLYFCGEVIDIDAETGGYNLQAAFSTGYVAGQSAADFILKQRH
jgi:predicted flavoprotein YhiN